LRSACAGGGGEPETATDAALGDAGAERHQGERVIVDAADDAVGEVLHHAGDAADWRRRRGYGPALLVGRDGDGVAALSILMCQ
jgi:hypothetical protein